MPTAKPQLTDQRLRKSGWTIIAVGALRWAYDVIDFLGNVDFIRNGAVGQNIAAIWLFGRYLLGSPFLPPILIAVGFLLILVDRRRHPQPLEPPTQLAVHAIRTVMVHPEKNMLLFNAEISIRNLTANGLQIKGVTADLCVRLRGHQLKPVPFVAKPSWQLQRSGRSEPAVTEGSYRFTLQPRDTGVFDYQVCFAVTAKEIEALSPKHVMRVIVDSTASDHPSVVIVSFRWNTVRATVGMTEVVGTVIHGSV